MIYLASIVVGVAVAAFFFRVFFDDLGDFFDCLWDVFKGFSHGNGFFSKLLWDGPSASSILKMFGFLLLSVGSGIMTYFSLARWLGKG